MIYNERAIRTETLIQAGKQLLIAARTAPKAKGMDIVECALITGEEIQQLSDAMKQYGVDHDLAFFLRDANNVLKSACVLLIGTQSVSCGLNCGRCGFSTCAERPSNIPCALNCTDVGIAIGSAVSKAADMRLDSRVMFSIGVAAQQLQWLGDDVTQVYGIPLSASSKSPLFDR